MAFVSENVIDRWFDPAENSWVYRGFVWLFQNPLWHGRVPKGFSLCPYFWLSLFSWVIFRPLVYSIFMPLILLCKGLFYIFGTPLSKMDAWLNEKLFDDRFKKHNALPCVILLLLIFGVIGFLMFCWWLIADIFYKSVVAITVLHAIGLTIACIYTDVNEYCSDRCKPIYYLVPTMLISLAFMAFISPAQLLACFVFAADFLFCILLLMGGLIALIGHGIWLGISWIFSIIGIGFKFLFSAIFAKFLGITIGLWVVLLGVFGLITMKICDWLERCQTKINVNDRNVTANDWKCAALDYFKTKSYILGELSDKVEYYVELNENLETLLEKDKENLIGYIVRKIIYNSIYNSKINVPDSLIGVSRYDLEKAKKMFDKDCGCNICKDFLVYLERLYTKIENVDVNVAMNSIVNKDDEINKWIEKYKNNYVSHKKHEETCSKYTKIASKIVDTIFYPFIKVGKGIWHVIKEIGRLMVYLWIVIKAVKKGACPYRTFGHQPKKPENVASNTKTGMHNE